MTTILYFAYGSNLNTTDLARYCKAEDLDASCMKPVGNALLPDYELSFSHYSVKRQGGALNLVPRSGNAVEGHLFEISEIGWQALDHKEGAHCGRYERQTVHVLTDNGELIEAQTYIKQVGANPPHFPPTEIYVDAVKAGLRHFDLETKMLEQATTNEPLQMFCDAVFVYGPLMRGQPQFSILDEFGITCCLLAEIPARLFDGGSQPEMLIEQDKRPKTPFDGYGFQRKADMQEKGDGSQQVVRGEFVRMRNFVAAIEHLDSVHRFTGFSADSRLKRRLVRADAGDGRERLAWTYLLAAPQDCPPIASGCWRTHCGETLYFQRLVEAHLVDTPLEDLVNRLRLRLPFEAESPDFPETVEQLAQALATGWLSERILAKVSNQWVAKF